jgi:hypothetical protein
LINAAKIIIIALLALTAVPAITAAPNDQAQTRRYLLSAGANNGGRERVLLRYAVTDARAFASVLLDMGGVDRNNALILANPSAGELLNGIANLNRLIAGDRAAAPDAKYEVFVYYSGHADTDGLKLSGETLLWSTFRNAVSGLDADVRVAVIDACGSGAITRTKGGTLQPAFMVDASSDMRGYVFLTSSNENEKSQESDRIRGSYFTHALLNGMRGAADLTGDGRVTINEAYQYAFRETLQSTQNTLAGTQHPSRDMNLAGTGDIVMTDLRETSAILSLAPDIEGRFFIRDASGNLFAELRKARGREVNFGISPGRYSVQVEMPSEMWMEGSVVVAAGRRTTLAQNDMRPMRRRMTVARGDGFPQSYSLNASIAGLSFAYGSGGEAGFFPAARGFGQSQFGLINIANSLESVQAGPVNVANSVGRFQGGLINTANDTWGSQIGAVNAANNASRSQIGAVNVAAKSGGRQIGLVNFARHSDKTPIGLLSIVGNGIYDVTAYADVTGDFYVSLRTGTPWFYNLFEYSSLASREYSQDYVDNFWSIGWGVGTRFGMRGRFTTNFDFVWQSVGSKQARMVINTNRDVPGVIPPNWEYDPTDGGGTSRDELRSDWLAPNHDFTEDIRNLVPGFPNIMGGPPGVDINIEYRVRFQDFCKLRFGANYAPLPYFAFTGGISLNVLLDSYTGGAAITHEPAGGFYIDRDFRDFKSRFWPGFFVGVTLGGIAQR